MPKNCWFNAKLTWQLRCKPVISRSVICMPLHTIRNSLICSNKHPRITDTSNYEQIIAEEFTLLISKSAGVDDIQMEIDETIYESQNFIS